MATRIQKNCGVSRRRAACRSCRRSGSGRRASGCRGSRTRGRRSGRGRRRAGRGRTRAARVDALDRDAALERRAQARRWASLEPADAVAHDVPAEDLLVDVGELDAAGELREVGVALDERLGVEDDEAVERSLVDSGRGSSGAARARCARRRGRGRGRSRRTRCARAGPRRPRASGPSASSSVDRPGGRRGSVAGALRAQHRALGAVDDVALGDAHVAGEHELLLDEVLHRLDGHVGEARASASAR